MRRRLMDVTRELAASNRQLEMLSRQDGLTGLSNRRYFDSFLSTEVRRGARAREPLSLILIDVDYFKAYNDAYGHQGGDECLKRIAVAMLSSCQRPGDLAARYGGEEFVLVLPSTGAEGAIRVADILAANIAQLAMPHARSQVHSCVTVSQGVVSLLPDADTAPEMLIEYADQALYRAKQQGRNRAVVYQPGR